MKISSDIDASHKIHINDTHVRYLTALDRVYIGSCLVRMFLPLQIVRDGLRFACPLLQRLANENS